MAEKEKMKTEKKKKVHKVAEKKVKNVKELASLMDSYNTTIIASTLNLESAQLQKARKTLREMAVVKFVKKSTALRALETSKKDGIKNLKGHVTESPAFIFSNSDPFEVSTVLSENRFPSKAKAGQIAPKEIKVEAGPTDLLPGPALAEFGAIGIKAGIVGGKIAVKEGKVLTKEGEKITEGVANILSKLEITPFEVGLDASAAYDSKENKVYTNIKIDKAGSLMKLQEAFSLAYQFAIGIAYPAKEVISQVLSRAEREALALNNMLTQNKSEGGN